MKRPGIKKCITAIACALTLVCCVGCGGSAEVERVTVYVSVDSAVVSSTAELVERVAGTVVEIQTSSIATQWNMQYVVSGAGSGVIAARGEDSSTYYVITNNHVVEGARDITVSLRTGEKYEATLVAADERGDIAVVSVKTDSELSVAVFGDSTALRVGEDVIAIGNPLGSLGGTVTKGIISATERSIPVGNHTMTLLQTDTAINPGNSGGGLFNMRGELVGVVNAKTSDEEVEGICFAIPVNTARSIFDDLLKNGVVTGRVTLGIDVQAYGNVGNAVIVTNADGAPENTFARYDRIAKIGDKTVNSVLDYNDALSDIAPGEPVSVTVYRGSVVSNWFGSQLAFETTPTTFTVTARQVGRREA